MTNLGENVPVPLSSQPEPALTCRSPPAGCRLVGCVTGPGTPTKVIAHFQSQIKFDSVYGVCPVRCSRRTQSMAIDSTIEWTDATWNPVAGCTPVSAGCRNCYAARMALRLATIPNSTGAKYRGTAERSAGGQPVFTGKIVLDRDSLCLPKSWRKSRLIFVNSMSDVFHESVPFEYIAEIFEVMRACPQHSFQVLTKRPERVKEVAHKLPWPSNIWMGTSVEDGRALPRVDQIREVPSRIRFLSCEPLIGSLEALVLDGIHWVIVGGESGPGSRPMLHEWVVEIREKCILAGVPFFFKQWGGRNKKMAGRKLDGQEWNGIPKRSVLGVF